MQNLTSSSTRNEKDYSGALSAQEEMETSQPEADYADNISIDDHTQDKTELEPKFLKFKEKVSELLGDNNIKAEDIFKEKGADFNYPFLAFSKEDIEGMQKPEIEKFIKNIVNFYENAIKKGIIITNPFYDNCTSIENSKMLEDVAKLEFLSNRIRESQIKSSVDQYLKEIKQEKSYLAAYSNKFIEPDTTFSFQINQIYEEVVNLLKESILQNYLKESSKIDNSDTNDIMTMMNKTQELKRKFIAFVGDYPKDDTAVFYTYAKDLENNIERKVSSLESCCKNFLTKLNNKEDIYIAETKFKNYVSDINKNKDILKGLGLIYNTNSLLEDCEKVVGCYFDKLERGVSLVGRTSEYDPETKTYGTRPTNQILHPLFDKCKRTLESISTDQFNTSIEMSTLIIDTDNFSISEDKFDYFKENFLNILEALEFSKISLLKLACVQKHDIVKDMIDYGAKFRKTDDINQIFSQDLASAYGLICLLLENKDKINFDINAQDAEGNNLLHALIALSHSTSTEDASSVKQYQKNIENIMKLLLANGLDINAQNKNGDTALHMLSFFKQSDFIADMVELGADLELRNNNGFSVIDVLFSAKQDYINKYSNDTYGKQPLEIVYFGNLRLELMRGLLKLGKHEEFNLLQEKYGKEACFKKAKDQDLMRFAIKNSLPDIANLAIFYHDKKTFLSEKLDEYGKNLYHYASELESPEMLKFLISTFGYKGLKVQDEDKNTPLLIAVKKGLVDIIEYLLNYDCDKGATDKENLSALEYIILNRGNFNTSDRIIELLLQDFEKYYELKKHSAFNIAVKKGYTDIMQKFFDKGYSPTQGSIDASLGYAALAVYEQAIEAMDLIKNNSKCQSKAPIYYFLFAGNFEGAKFLLNKDKDEFYGLHLNDVSNLHKMCLKKLNENKLKKTQEDENLKFVIERISKQIKLLAGMPIFKNA